MILKTGRTKLVTSMVAIAFVGFSLLGASPATASTQVSDGPCGIPPQIVFSTGVASFKLHNCYSTSVRVQVHNSGIPASWLACTTVAAGAWYNGTGTPVVFTPDSWRWC